ncbi:MAG: sigma-70 family RNA polymerase sigma factor [Candidatus Limnocylindrales bacterium]
MHAWSEAPYFHADLRGPWQVTGPSADRRTMDALWAPVAAGRLRVAVPGESAGLQPTYAVRDDVAATPTDAELMARVAAGDQQAFAAVYDRHAPAVYGAVMRYLRDPGAAEDVVQETYLATWTRADSYAPEAGSLIGWLLTIARRRAIDRLRAASRQPLLVGLAPAHSDGAESDVERLLALRRPVALADTADTAVEPSDVAERRWVRAVVRTALAAMPEPERRALELAYDDELTQPEIAERLGWPLGTVKTRTRRALMRLRAMLESVPDIGPSSGQPPSEIDGRDPEEVQHGPR